jgi:hypothetical protein
MEQSSGVAIGPYRFGVVDTRRTVAEAVDLLDEYGGHDPAVAAALAPRRERLVALLGGLDAWQAPFEEVAPLLPSVWEVLSGARGELADAGLLPGRTEGSVVGLHLGDGGVPKRSVRSVDVDHGGVVGDRQGTRRHHGAPWQALCLWSEEVIAAFAAGGHPVGPGFAGENVTVAGLEWGRVRPGARLEIGTVVCEVSSYAVPCRQLAEWFSDRDFSRIHHRHGPVSRVYATVIAPGTIDLGDQVVVEPRKLGL